MRAINYYAHNEADEYDFIIAAKNNKPGTKIIKKKLKERLQEIMLEPEIEETSND